ncbi:phage tail tape measure protein [Murimonas intestini]|uniref:phage tail tape measure protein n=1 Tax=Murimonas intestini TaxID=1337051 RepID=UPI000D6AD811|nr:phage tail tape measure protein [Murimonas intestini]MCR1867908.1 phage tail tape measure protein [Murimonas intestini]MCR1885260.1 phage tail tape measure protein [Murimonas intestini]
MITIAESIGATIELDGEKDFKAGVTACNKSLTALKTEMGLVKAQTEGQANSLESLQKKHSVLTKILEEQNNKEKEVRKGLDNAEQAYKNVGNGLDALKQKLTAATAELDQMRQSSSSAPVDIAKQEKAVEELNREIEKGEKNYQTAGNRVKDWQAKLNTAQAQTVKATKALNENAAYMEEAENATDKCATSIDKFGKATQEATEVSRKWTEVLRDKAISSAADILKDSLTGAVSSTLELQDASNQLKASTGAGAAEMQKMNSVLKDAYNNNYGESYDDVADVMERIRQTLGDMDASNLQEITESAIALRDTFDMDYQEQLRAVKSLMQNFGIDSKQAYNLIVQGAQQGLNKNDDLLDTINEYSSYYAGAGRSADDFFNSLKNGAEAGTFSVDKLGDAYKEFTIRAKDTATTTTEGYQLLGLNADKMRAQFAAGGESARQATEIIVKSLFSLDDDVKRNQAGVDLFGTMWEDLGEKGIRALTSVEGGISSSYNAMDRLKSIKYDSVTNSLEELGRKFKSEISEPIVENVLPKVVDGISTVIDNIDLLIPAVTGVGTAFVAYKTITATVTAFSAATEGATTAQTIFNAVLGANPVIKIVTAVIAAGAAIITYANNAGEASAEVEMLVEENKRVVASANEVTESVDKTIASYSDSTAQMEAQGQYAGILAERISGLAGKTQLSSSEMDVMYGYIAELNSIVPGLSLAYDEQAGKLNMTTEEMYKNIEASQKQIAQQAAQEYAIQLIKKKTELEIESIKLQNSGADISERRNTLLEEENDLMLKDVTGITALISGKKDEREEYKLLTEQQEDNTDAVKANEDAKKELAAEEAAVKKYLEEAGVSWDEVTGQVNANTTATDANTEAQGKNNTTLMESASQIAETYTSLKESVTGALESQMNMFEEFSAGTEISTYDLLHNMQSQIDGVTNWADNLNVLSQRGINEGLLQHLAEMGPEGANYVAAFARMSDDELQKASSMWEESLDIKDGVQENISGMMDGVTTAISGGKDKVKAAMQEVGVNTIAGLTEKLQGGQVEVKAAGDDVGQAAVDGAKTGAGTHSPSWKTEEIGRNMNEGLVNGLKQSKGNVSNTVQQILNEIIRSASSGLRASNFASSGRNVTLGMAQGINAGRSNVTSAMQILATQTQTAASTGMNPLRYAVYGMQVPSGLVTGMNRGRTTVATAAKNLGITAYNNVRVPSLYSDGLNVAYGLANGISAGRSAVVSAVANMCASAVNQARSSLKIHSPSGVFAEIGEYTAEGFGVGYEDKIADVNGMIKKTMDYSRLKPGTGSGTAAGASMGAERIIIEMPIYNNGIYDRTEIAEIAMEGLSRAQGRKLAIKGGIQNVRYAV